jgi:hypothetical protein
MLTIPSVTSRIVAIQLANVGVGEALVTTPAGASLPKLGEGFFGKELAPHCFSFGSCYISYRLQWAIRVTQWAIRGSIKKLLAAAFFGAPPPFSRIARRRDADLV